MLYLYKNELDRYQLIDDIDSKETKLLETLIEQDAVDAFMTEVSNRRKKTILAFNGSDIVDYRGLQ